MDERGQLVNASTLIRATNPVPFFVQCESFQIYDGSLHNELVWAFIGLRQRIKLRLRMNLRFKMNLRPKLDMLPCLYGLCSFVARRLRKKDELAYTRPAGFTAGTNYPPKIQFKYC